jgi:hypothetical protein
MVGGGRMKARKPPPPVYRSRDPGPRELQRRHMENIFARAEAKAKPRAPEYRRTSPDDANEPRDD